jgi:hypothetical protein
MAYFLGKDVSVGMATEQQGIDGTVSGAFVDTQHATLMTMSAVSGTSDVQFAKCRVSGTAAAGAEGAVDVSDLTGVDVSIGAVDEDISYFGYRSVTKAEIKKETTVTLTRKKKDAAWETVYNSGRYGVNSAGSFTANALTMPTVNTGYRLYVQMKSSTEVFTIPGCCIQSHSVSVNADGTSEETMEFMSYVTPLVGTGNNTTAITGANNDL